MRIILVNDYGYQLGGAETHFFELAELLSKNHQVLTVTSDYCHQGKELISDRQISASGNYFDLDRAFNFKNYFQFKKIVKDFCPDVVHFHNIFYQLSPSVVFASRSIRTVMTLHDYCLICDGQKVDSQNMICEKSYSKCRSCKSVVKPRITNKLKNYSARVFSKMIDQFIAPSTYIKTQFQMNNYENVTYLPHFIINISHQVPMNSNPEPYFLYLGRIVKQKGVNLIVKAFMDPRLSDYNLYIAGSGDEEDNIKKLIKQLGLEQRVKLVGRVEGSTKSDLVRNSLANLLPSTWPEVVGLSIYEAATHGRLSIASNVGGIRDFIQHGVTGFLIDSHSPEAWSETLNQFISISRSEMLVLLKNLNLKVAEQDPQSYIEQIILIYS